MSKATTRTSKKFPGLTLDLLVNSQGAWITFRRGAAFEVFRLATGQAVNVDCFYRDALTSLEMRHCLRTTIHYAEMLNKPMALAV